MPKCPVCEKKLGKSLPPFCSTCGWDTKNDLGLGTFLGEIPEAVVEEYKQRLSVARKNWKAREEIERERREMEKKLKLFESRLAEMELQKEKQKAAAPKAEKAPPAKKEASNRKESPYSRNTPAPDLKRDPFETVKEFVERIGGHQPVYAGEAVLVKEKYDIDNALFPLEIKWEKWAQEMAGTAGPSPRIKADRKLAKALYDAGTKHPIFVQLKAKDERVSVAKVVLVSSVSNIEVAFEGDGDGKEWIEPVTGMILVRVPAGKFMMGDTFGDGYDNEKPVHEVELDGFYLGKYPVTQGQWKKVMGNNPSNFQKGDDYPVEQVSWNDAKEFIEKLQTRNAGRYEFALPTEAQWEYAARSGGKKERYAGGDDVDAVAWYGGNSDGSTHAVGKKRPNGLGIYDMSGNVLEWCQDIYDSNAYKNHAKRNPIYAGGGSLRVIRGGGWGYDPRYVRCADRSHHGPAYRDYHLGFRLARK